MCVRTCRYSAHMCEHIYKQYISVHTYTHIQTLSTHAHILSTHVHVGTHMHTYLAHVCAPVCTYSLSIHAHTTHTCTRAHTCAHTLTRPRARAHISSLAPPLSWIPRSVSTTPVSMRPRQQKSLSPVEGLGQLREHCGPTTSASVGVDRAPARGLGSLRRYRSFTR